MRLHAYELSFAAIDIVDDDFRLGGKGAGIMRLCFGGAKELSVFLVWRLHAHSIM